MTVSPTAMSTDPSGVPRAGAAGPGQGALSDARTLMQNDLETDRDLDSAATLGGAGRGRRLRQPASPSSPTVADRAEQALQASGFPPYLVEGRRVVLSGFVVESESADWAKVRWLGQPAIDSAPYRRTFLRVYAAILVDAGLTVRHVADADADEAYLVCRAT